MLVETIRAAINRWYMRAKYPRAAIGNRARISRDSHCAEKFEVSNDSVCVSSQLSECVRLSSFVTVHNSFLGEHVYVGAKSRLVNSRIDAFSYVAEETLIGETSVGRYCSVGPRSIFGYGKHPTETLSTSPIFYSPKNMCRIQYCSEHRYPDELSPINIGNDVWIGAMSYIANGITIGNGAVVGAGAVVTRNVPDYAIVGGVPARTIRMRFDDKTIEKMLRCSWWNYTPDELKCIENESINDVSLVLSKLVEERVRNGSSSSDRLRTH